MNKFDHYGYLQGGTAGQQEAFGVLYRSQIIEKLADFKAILIGTIPIDIAVAGSDLDIACQAADLDSFAMYVEAEFSSYQDFKLQRLYLQGHDTVVVNFYVESFEVELFCQPIAVKQQNGFRHMCIEDAILTKKGQTFKDEILALKTKGIKTEPAFAQLLGIEGDPYVGLLNYKE